MPNDASDSRRRFLMQSAALAGGAWLARPAFAADEAAGPLVLILCTGNSCRSHLAEGILRARAQGRFRVASAGSKPAGFVHPLSIRAMQEIGIDISGHHSKHMNEFLTQEVETVITVCGKADQVCPTFPGQVNRHHMPFDDPAHATGTDEEKMVVFRRVRDEIVRTFEAYAAGRLDQAKAKQAV
jgi:arsenate reductase